MGQLLRRSRAALLCTGVLLGALATAARATDLEFELDMRAVDSDAARSFTEGGLGTTRFGENQSGLQLGRVRFALTQPLGEVLTVHLDASSWGDGSKDLIGLTESYLQFRPYPVDGFRFRVKAGAFYAPISLENRASGWESPYTVSYSALNSWLAEELRTIGVEGQVDWLGTRTGHGFDVALIGGVFGWNEGAGAALTNRGFNFDDRQTLLFDRIGPPAAANGGGIEPFREIDGRAGVYAGLEARYYDRLVLRVLRYDNRADPNAYAPSADVYAWHTRFDSAGLRYEDGDGWTLIAQWLDGQTFASPDGMTSEWPFKACFALVAKRIGRQSLSVRYDRFEIDSVGEEADGSQKGHAWTAAYLFDASEQWHLALEWLRVISTSYDRMDNLGVAPFATETQIQLAVRYTLRASIR